MKNKSKIKIYSALIAGVMLGSIIYVYSIFSKDIEATGEQSENNVKTVEIHASWSHGYSSFGELIQDSDLIAYATVGEVVKEWRSAGLPKTDVELTITKPIYNSKKGQQIIITQTGGQVEEDGQQLNYLFGGDPLFSSGENYLIFARQNDIGTYTILGGPQGKFKNINGKVQSMKNVAPSVEIGNIDLDGVNASELDSDLLEQVRKIKKK